MELIREIAEGIKERQTFVVATVVEKSGDGPVQLAGRLIADASGKRFGTVGGGALEVEVIRKCQEILKDKKHTLVKYDLGFDEATVNRFDSSNPVVYIPMICGGTVSIFYECVAPLPRLVIFGGGNVGGALLAKLRGTGFELNLWDVELTTHEPWFNAMIALDEAISACDAEAYAVISTGSHEMDYEILKQIKLAGKNPHYLGLLASKKKIAEIKKRLILETGSEFERVYSPIGLDIGAANADEIAIAIAAQLIAKRSKKTMVEDMG